MKCIIIDDEMAAIDILTEYIKKTSFLELLFSTQNPVEGLAFLNNNKVDIVFVDIHMNDLSGFQVVQMSTNVCKFIFTTAYSDYAIDAFEAGIFDYLLKPISFPRFLKSVQKAFADHIKSISENDFVNDIFVKLEGKGRLTKVKVDDILYIEGLGNYLSIHTNKSTIVTLSTFRDFEEALDNTKFIRTHKSYMVAVNHILGIDGNELLFKKETGNEIKIPVGITYRDFIKSLLSDKGLGYK